MAALDNIASELLKSANEADLNFKKTRDQAQRDKAVRLRKIVENLRQLGGGTATLDQVTTAGNTTANTINVGGITSDYFQLDTAATPTLAPGMFAWNDAYGTADLRLKGNNVTLQLGQETLARVVNKTGSDLLESQYKVVRVRVASEGGAQGQRLAVVLAQGLNDPESATTLGIVTENIANNQEGFITVFGNVNNINTTGSLQGETWVDGDVLYLSPTTAGGLTKVKPTAPNHMVIIGYVVYAHAVNGKIFVKVDNGYELDELHNVLINGVANNDLLQYDGTTQVWKNKTISAIFGGTPLVSVPTLAQVTTAGNTTTNAISLGGLDVLDANSRVNISPDPWGRGAIMGINAISISPEGTNKHLRIITATSGAASKISIGYYKATTGWYAAFHIDSANSNPPLLLQPEGNNVLIGTTTDNGQKLQVNGTTRLGGITSVLGTTEDASNTASLTIQTTNTSLRLGGNTTYSWIQSHSSKPLYINELGNNVILNLGAGSVGIGTASPSAKLHVADTMQLGTTSNASFSFRLTRTSGAVPQDAHFYAPTNNSPSVFYIEGGYYTGEAVGTSTAANSGYPYYERYFGNGSTSSYKHLGFINVANGSFGNTNLIPSIALLSTGNVGFGTTSPTYKIDVQGTTLAGSSVRAQGSFDINPLAGPPVIGGYTLSAGTNLGVGTYYYFVVYVTALGETNAGSILTVTTTTGNTTVNLTGIPVSSDPRVTARKLYRTKVGGTSDNQWFLATISDNVTTTYTDSIADASLTGVGLQYYKVNTTARYFTVSGTQGMIIDQNLTALGRNAGNAIITSNATAVRTVLIGANAGQNITTGTSNVIVGVAGGNVTTGSDNSLFGDLVGYNLTIGYGNTIVGAQAGRFLNSGYQNIFIGQGAGSYLTNGSTQVTTAFQNIAIGRNTRLSTINDSNSIIIGDTALGLGSNTTVIGNSSTTFTSIPAGNMTVGGTTNAGYKFDVNGTARIQSSLTVDTDTLFVDATNNRVGIGTTTPGDKLSIVDASNANIFGRITANGTNASAAWVAQNDQVDNVVYRVFGSAVTGSQMGISLARSASLMANLNGTGSFLIGTYSGTDLILGTANNENMRISNNTGNVLIGTTTDIGNMLEVAGVINSLAYSINNVPGYTGTLNIPGNPPGQQNVDIQSGIIVNIF